MTITRAMYEEVAEHLNLKQIAFLRGLYRSIYDARNKPYAHALTISKLNDHERSFLYMQLVETYGVDSSLARMVKSYGLNE